MLTSHLIANRIGSPGRVNTSPVSTTRRTRGPRPPKNDLNRNLRKKVLEIRESDKDTGTHKAHNPKAMEYIQYCEHVCDENDPYKYILVSDSIYNFMWYQSFREQKQKGLTKEKRAIPADQRIYFDAEDYDQLMKQSEKKREDADANMPNPQILLAFNLSTSTNKHQEDLRCASRSHQEHCSATADAGTMGLRMDQR
ncbi:unknown protein [Seminavis robusta]|uniref:Uncharacterized protein n=1 Tax=Seminavis robusta TaxID=568900 RepID=A0A9N8DIM9_9STRA|nr:unknown protein [Seminavis robusta]|eukprot:Sro103_g052630.1 n/a (197) ;mRNA; f:113179-113769